jgi:short-chain fatty acids transporter
MTNEPPDSEDSEPESASQTSEPASSEWIDVLSRVMQRWVPDALTTAVALMVVLVAMSLMFGASATETVKAYYDGLWMFLRFTMQMTLILVLSLVLAATPVFRMIVMRVAKIPNTRIQVVTMASLTLGIIAYLNWGLALALGPMISIHFCREAERKGIAVDFLFLMATLAGVGSIWQFGLSASAPLIMATPGQEIVQGAEMMPLSTTIWSTAALVHVTVFLIATIIAGCSLMPKKTRPISDFPGALQVAELGATRGEAAAVRTTPATPAQRMESSPLVIAPLVAMLGTWLYYHFFIEQRSLDLNAVNTTLLFSGLLLHSNVGNFQNALADAIKVCWPVVVLYHLYAGVAGLIQFTPVGQTIVDAIAPISTPYTFPFLVAAVSTIVAIFIPTSGGQWAIQGSITTAAAEAVGVTPQRALLALSVGDHMGNLLTPFWAVVGANIARVDFRLYFGYRLIFAALWFVIGVICFTFLPC